MTAKKTAAKATAKKTAKKAAKKTLATETPTKKATTKSIKKSTTRVTAPSGSGVKTTPLAKPPAPASHTMPEGQIVISRIGTETIRIPILGTAPLITNNFSEKSKRTMADNMEGRKQPKQPKRPRDEFEAAAYRLDDGGYGVPAIAFKLATVSAARLYGKNVTMKGLLQTFFFSGEFSSREGRQLVRIISPDLPEMREDVVRVGNNGTDLRYRPYWEQWEAELEVTYIKSMLTRDSVVSLVEAGGMSVGVAEWRIEKKGEYGTYLIHPEKQVRVVSE